jgi:uncharacterized protein YggE
METKEKYYIEVTGKSEMEISPDLIYIKIIINDKDNKTKFSIIDRESKMISALNNLGIDTNKDILIKDITSNFKHFMLSKTEIVQSKEYKLTVREGKILSKVFVELQNIGISNLSIIELDHSNLEKYRTEIKIAAIKDAKEKSEALTSAIGEGIGKAIFIREIENNYRYETVNFPNAIYSNVDNSKSNYDMEETEPEINFEKIKLNYSIFCRFELK